MFLLSCAQQQLGKQCGPTKWVLKLYRGIVKTQLNKYKWEYLGIDENIKTEMNN